MKRIGILAFILIYLVNCNFLSNSSNKDKSRNLFKLLAAYFYLNSSTTTAGLKLTSPAVKYNILPFSFTCDGLDSTGFRGGITPSLSISNVPSGTYYFAITMHTTKGTSDNLEYESLWVLYDIPVANTSLASVDANIAPAGTLGISQDGAQVYFPPCSSQPILNTYVITVYALPKALGLSASTTTYSILTAAASEAKLESTTLSLTNIRYNPDATTDLQVPTSVPTTCATKSVSFSNYTETSISCTSTTMTVTSATGLPSRSSLDGDKPTVGTESWIGRVPLSQSSSWKIPLVPSYLGSTANNIYIHYHIGITVDGIPILHYAKESSNTEVSNLSTNYSARDTVLLGELDQCGAHAGNGEDYHYHYAPVCMMDTHDPSTPLAYMFDGIPLYFGTGGGTVTGSTSVNYGAGRYSKLDFRPNAVKTGAQSLDACNAYDINSDGAVSGYVYYTTKTAPYTIGCFRGVADQVNSVYAYSNWGTDRNISWSGSEVLLNNYYTGAFNSQTWNIITMTPKTGNTKLASGNTGVILYRELTSGEAGYVSGSSCWSFRYRTDSTDTTGANDTTEIQCR